MLLYCESMIIDRLEWLRAVGAGLQEIEQVSESEQNEQWNRTKTGASVLTDYREFREANLSYLYLAGGTTTADAFYSKGLRVKWFVIRLRKPAELKKNRYCLWTLLSYEDGLLGHI